MGFNRERVGLLLSHGAQELTLHPTRGNRLIRHQAVPDQNPHLLNENAEAELQSRDVLPSRANGLPVFRILQNIPLPLSHISLLLHPAPQSMSPRINPPNPL